MCVTYAKKELHIMKNGMHIIARGAIDGKKMDVVIKIVNFVLKGQRNHYE